MVAIATQSSAPPLRLSDLAKMYKVSPFSLRMIANLMQQQKTYLQFDVRDISLLKTVKSYSELQASWATSAHPSMATLQQLSQTLSGAGASIKYVSDYWHQMGIAGNLGPLVGLNVYRLDLLAGSAPSTSDGLHPLDLSTGEKWLAVGGLAATVGLGLLAIASAPADLLVIAVITTLPGLSADALAAAGISLFVAGSAVAIGSLGVMSFSVDPPTASNQPSSPSVCICSPSGTDSDFPVDAGQADTGVLTTPDIGDAYAEYNSPDVNVSQMEPSPPPTTSPGTTPAPLFSEGGTFGPWGPSGPEGTSGPGGTFGPPSPPVTFPPVTLPPVTLPPVTFPPLPTLGP